MRKLIMLALGLGAAELFRRHAAKTGNTPTGLIATVATNALASLRGAALPSRNRWRMEEMRHD